MIFLSILSFIFLCSSGFFGFVCYKYGKMLMNVEDNMQDCLDRVDTRYRNFQEILKDQYLESNDPIVKKFMDQVRGLQNDILIMANQISQANLPFEKIIGEADQEALAPSFDDSDLEDIDRDTT